MSSTGVTRGGFLKGLGTAASVLGIKNVSPAPVEAQEQSQKGKSQPDSEQQHFWSDHLFVGRENHAICAEVFVLMVNCPIRVRSIT